MSKKNCQQIPTMKMIPNSQGFYQETYKCTSPGGTNSIGTKTKHVLIDEPLYETNMPLTVQAMLLNSSLGGGMDMMPSGVVMPDIGMGGMGLLPHMMRGNKNEGITDLVAMSLLLPRRNDRQSYQQQTTSASIPTVNMIPPQENFEVKMLPDIN